MERRKFVKSITGLGLTGSMLPLLVNCGSPSKVGSESEEAMAESSELFFKISLAEWSLNKAIKSGELSNLDFPGVAKKEFGITAVEYVNQLFEDRSAGQDYLKELKIRTDDLGIENVLIMIDHEGDLGGLDDSARNKSVENHYKWVEAAKFLGCHSIRVNAAGKGTPEEVKAAAIDGLGRLSEFGSKHNIQVIVENHGGISSNGKWLADLISQVNSPFCGTLPDFGNFCIKRNEKDDCMEEYDRYQGIFELMPFARGVSAKSNAFDENGNETKTNFVKMLKIVKKAGYRGYIGIEYEGPNEYEGIAATKKLLEKAGLEV